MAPLDRREWLRAAATFALTPALAPLAPVRGQAPPSPWSARKKKTAVLGLDMAYYEAGQGDAIVFLHGNPTSSYLWRNVIPHVQHLGRCIAPDMIGMGDSAPLPDSGPGKYTLLTHRAYLFGLFDALNLGDDVTLVVHDWGSAIGIMWARERPRRVKGIAHMEAILAPPGAPRPAPAPGSAFATYRSPAGEKAVLEDNMFVERLIEGLRYFLTEEDAAEYRRPYLVPGESRRPTLTWPRQLPLGGEPKDVYQLVRDYTDWLAADTELPKLFVRAVPGALVSSSEMLEYVRGFRNQTEATVYGPHFVQEVSPHAIGRALAAWLPTLRSRRQG